MNLPLNHLPDAQSPSATSRQPVAVSFERRRLRIYLSQMLGDIAAIFAAYLLAALIYLGPEYLRTTELSRVTLPAQLLTPLYLTISLHNGTFSLESLKSWQHAATRAVLALITAAALFNVMIFFVRLNTDYSRITFSIALLLTILAQTGMRRLTIEFIRRRWGPNPFNVMVIEDGGPPIDLLHTYRVNFDEPSLRPSLDDPYSLDQFARIMRNMDRIIVSCPPERRLQWAMVLKGIGVHGEVMSDFMKEIGALGVVHHEEIDMTTLLVSTGPLGMRARVAKRLFDLSVASIALIVVMPILLVAALAIRIEDGGPVFFRQKRIGRRNEMFSIFKLRTMKVEDSDSQGQRSARKDDDRITRVGNFLRRTSIDELPQIFNVLTGDMSLVGPRPHAIGSLAGEKLFWEVDQRYWHRHSLRPGLTGLAQVRGLRGATDKESDLTSRLQADLEYLSGWTIWRDVRIMLATLRVLVHDRAF